MWQHREREESTRELEAAGAPQGPPEEGDSKALKQGPGVQPSWWGDACFLQAIRLGVLKAESSELGVSVGLWGQVLAPGRHLTSCPAEAA